MQAYGRYRVFAALLGLLLVASTLAATPGFERDCRALVSQPHRLSGTPEYRQAADTIEQRLKDAGVDQVIVQPFPMTQTRVIRCELRVEGAPVPLRLAPMRPDGILPPVTPPQGISGRLVCLDVASADAFATQEVAGAIAVVDYNSGADWLRALRLGAKAVIFVRNGPCDGRSSHYVAALANLPRFYYPGPAADLPVGRVATLQSEVVWEAAAGRNVFGFVRGTAPVFDNGQDEVVLVAANLDTFGEVPSLSPGARGAANCAGLLKLGAHLVRQRPRRHVLLAFFDDQARLHAGVSAFYRALDSDPTTPDEARVSGRRQSLEQEQAFVHEAMALLAHPEALSVNSPVRRQVMYRLGDKAAEHAFDAGDRLYRLRDELRALESVKAAAPDIRGRRAALGLSIREEWEPEKDRWNTLRRELGRDNTENLPRDIRQRLVQALGEVGEDLEARTRELQGEAQALVADEALQSLLGGQWIALHLSLLLGDATPSWGLAIGGDSAISSQNDLPGLYGKVQNVFRKAYDQASASSPEPLHFIAESTAMTQTRALWAGARLIHGGEVAGLFGIYNLAFVTCQESAVREGTPDDTLTNLNLDRVEAQVDEVTRLLSTVANIAGPAREPVRQSEATEGGEQTALAVADQRGLSLRRGIRRSKEYAVSAFQRDQAQGLFVMGRLKGTSMPNKPMGGAVVQFRLSNPTALSYESVKSPAFDDFQVKFSTRNGTFDLGPVYGQGRWGWSYRGVAVAFDERGLARAASDQESYATLRRLNVLDCRPGHTVLPPQKYADKQWWGDDVRLLASGSNARLDPRKGFVETTDGVMGWLAYEREKGFKFFNLQQEVGLNNGSETDPGVRTEGPTPGYPAATDWNGVAMTARSATDLWRLNDERIRILRSKNILDPSLAELHGRAEDVLLEAKAETSPSRREALYAAGFWASQPVYTKTREVLDDLVFAVLILLGLSVPFAFALERVVIGATTVYRQIGWFVGFFALTFAALFLTHPAFAIANTPVIIFLGFAIVVMAALVIHILLRRFEQELKALKGLSAVVHVADVSRASTFMAAMQMGISTMRRRPLRTALTAITIVLLTFTILCFAAFTTRSGIVTVFAAPKPVYSGVGLHDVNWRPLAPGLLDVLRGRWGRQAMVCPRLWISPKTVNESGILLTRADGTKPTAMNGMLGLAPAELRERPDLAALMALEDDRTVLITEAVARSLKVKEGDTVLVRGEALHVGRLLDAVALAAARDMDGGNLLPADFTDVSSRQPQGGGQDEIGALNAAQWTALPADAVVIVSAATAQRLGARLYGALLYPRDGAQTVGLAEELARMVPMPVAATRADGVYLHVLGTILAASGVNDLLFPILLGGLVIFGTMLGSVSDREREIYTFSALGLAPRHVATLFFAESIVYSLLGGMGGYLLAQGTLRVMSLLADLGWATPPDMNMSSTNTIVTILLVMATVLISSIYPAIKASRSANPGLMRAWKPPAAKGDVLDIVFPFTVSEYDITGVVSFLKEHFDNFSDTGLGQFMAKGCALTRDERKMLGLRAEVALAPFDLGVSQTFELRSAPSGIQGIDEVNIKLRRVSGQPDDWQRLNKVFLDDLRRQFLIWRSLSRQTMETYRGKTLETWTS